jgi:hypothetical protein
METIRKNISTSILRTYAPENKINGTELESTGRSVSSLKPTEQTSINVTLAVNSKAVTGFNFDLVTPRQYKTSTSK